MEENMRFLRVNMTDQSIHAEDVPENYRTLGGRALTSTLVQAEVAATADPLGPENKLVFAPGYFTGTPLVNTSRLSVGGKSPLTGGIKEQRRRHRRLLARPPGACRGHRRGAGPDG
jgi:aldehyde:ferredoxin oxidoreductase